MPDFYWSGWITRKNAYSLIVCKVQQCIYVNINQYCAKVCSWRIDEVTTFKRSVNLDNARCVLDGRAEARIIELARGPVPDGQSAYWKKNQDLFLTLLLAVKQSEEL